MLTPDEILLIIIMLGMLVLIISNRIAIDVVAVIVLLTLTVTGLMTPEEALSGFSSSVVITLMGLFMITQTLEDTGIIRWIAQRISVLGRNSETRLMVLFMCVGAGLSLIMHTVAAAAVMVPAVVQVGRMARVPLSRLLIPMSFGTLLGGMATYLTTANIIISDILQQQGLEGLGMMDFIPTGGLIAIVGLLYMYFIGRRWLPVRAGLTDNLMDSALHQTYQLDDRMWEIKVLPGSRLAQVTLAESGIGARLGLTVLAVWRGQRAIFSPEQDITIQAGDYLLVLGREDRVDELTTWGTVRSREHPTFNHKYDTSVDFTEVIIPPRSSAIGKTLTELKHRNQFGLTTVAIWREGRSYRTDVGKMSLQVGDALLMVGPAHCVKHLAEDRDYLVPTEGYASRPLRPHKARWALVITVITLLVAIFNLFPMPHTMLAGSVALVLTGCLSMEEAYRAVEWRVVFLIVGLLPLSMAMMQTGFAARIGHMMVAALGDGPPLLLVAGMFLLTAVVTQIFGGQVTGLVLGPIAITAAQQTGISPQAMAVAVAIGCSTAFLTPISHPVNILIMGPGGYQFGDFFKIGLGLSVVTGGMLLVGMALFWQM